MGHEFDKLVEDVLNEASVKIDSRASRMFGPALKKFKNNIEKAQKRVDDVYKNVSVAIAEIITEAIHYESGDEFEDDFGFVVNADVPDASGTKNKVCLVACQSKSGRDISIDAHSLYAINNEVNRYVSKYDLTVDSSLPRPNILSVKVYHD
jgi:hypothetical protein